MLLRDNYYITINPRKCGKTLAQKQFLEFLRVSKFNMKKKIGGKLHKFTLTGATSLPMSYAK